jgi:hypothetical protein
MNSRIPVLLCVLMPLMHFATTGCKTADSSQVKTLPEAKLIDFFDHDFPYYQSLVQRFKGSGLDFTVNVGNIHLLPPLEGPFNLLSRFGTPTFGGIDFFGASLAVGYFHGALDFARRQPGQSSAVRAPVSGLAAVVLDCAPDETKCRENTPAYGTSVVIYDKTSHALVGLLHVKPRPDINSAKDFVPVKAGEVIGELGALEDSLVPDRPEFRHTHLMLIDFKNDRLLNPSLLVEGYRDTLPPLISGVRVFDAAGRQGPPKGLGRFDLVVDAYDLDDHSIYHQEVASVVATARDQDGHVLFTLPRCLFDDFYFQSRQRPRSPLFALETASIVNEMKPNDVNVLRPDLSFGYVITNLKVDATGKCSIVNDDEGFVEIGASVQQIDLDVTAFDHFGNQFQKKVLIPVAK